MKTLKKMILTTVLAITSSFAFAGGTPVNGSGDAYLKLKNEIRKKINFPSFLSAAEKETVNVSFVVWEDGRVSVVDIESTNEQLKRYVHNSFEKLTLKSATEVNIHEVYKIGFHFKTL